MFTNFQRLNVQTNMRMQPGQTCGKYQPNTSKNSIRTRHLALVLEGEEIGAEDPQSLLQLKVSFIIADSNTLWLFNSSPWENGP